MAGETLQPKVLILDYGVVCPTVSGANIRGMLFCSGGKLFIVKDAAGTWECVGSQSA